MERSKPNVELADVFCKFSHLLGPQSLQRYKVMRDIQNCRTAVLGGHRDQCSDCGGTRQSYNSCRNRHCPKCQFLPRARWVEKRVDELLACQYFHVVFTLPSEIKDVVLQNPRVCYDLLFKAASETIKKISPHDSGCIGVLHTWSQNLVHHPHVHFIVPGGGLSKDKTKWVPCKKGFFAPIRVLSKVFRGKFLSMMETAFREDKLKFYGSCEHLRQKMFFDEIMIQCAAKEFVVYAKKPFAGPKQVIDYLGQYTHRIAISNYRIRKLDGEMVSFKVRDKKNPKKKKMMVLHVKEFMRRFLLHALPRGFVRIRHFGILGNRYKKRNIQIIRNLCNVIQEKKTSIEESWKEFLKRIKGIDIDLCAKCKKGIMEEVTQMPLLLSTA